MLVATNASELMINHSDSANSEDSSASNRANAYRQARFATTSWSVVLQAATDNESNNQYALATLCEAYWYPLYAFVRRMGNSAADAEDLTQSFFVELLQKSKLAKSDPSRGRFRTFLLSSLQNYLKNEHRKNSAIKRGGQHSIVSIDFTAAESQYNLEPSHEQTPQRAFDKNWAFAVLNQVLVGLEQQYSDAGKLGIYNALKDHLVGTESAPYSKIADELGMKVGAIKVAIHRLRERYGQMLRLQIAKTIEDPANVDQELRHLFEVISE